MREITPTRAAALEFRDERRAMREGHAFLDEKCLLLAGAIVRELARHTAARAALDQAHQQAMDALQAAIARHGLEGLEVYPVCEQAATDVSFARRAVMGVPLQDAIWPLDAPPAPPAVNPSPDAKACRNAFLALIAAAAETGAIVGNLERLSREYRRSVRRARALQDVLLPEIERTIAGIEARLEEEEQEDAVRMRRV